MGGVYKDILYSLSIDPLFCLKFVKIKCKVLTVWDMIELKCKGWGWEKTKTNYDFNVFVHFAVALLLPLAHVQRKITCRKKKNICLNILWSNIFVCLLYSRILPAIYLGYTCV